ncbi:MAG: TonB-dependent receptor [Elusimicrobiota bacterium]
MKKGLLVLWMAVVLVLGVGFEVVAQESTEEELLFSEIPIVVSAGKKKQLATEALATICVVTDEEIKQSGATNIPDILRMVSGVDVLALSARDQNVSIRGFITPINNKLLVLIDGRSVYWDAYGIVFWDAFPVSLDEIDRIEIVKSPISSLYGANAYCGVINIITKSPARINQTEISVTGGNFNTLLGTILHAKVTPKIDYKVSIGLDKTNSLRDSSEKAGDIVKGNVFVEYKFSDDNKLSFSSGRSQIKDRKLFVDESVGAAIVDSYFDYAQFEYNYKNLKLRNFAKQEDSNTDFTKFDIERRWLIKTYDLEFQNLLDIGKKHSLIYGASYRYNAIDKSLVIPQSNSQNLYAIFGEDELKISDKFKLSVGGRYDCHSLVKEHFSPRGTIWYSPFKEHIFRLSAVQAFRNPTLIDSYADDTYNLELKGVGIPATPITLNIPYDFKVQGNKNLKSEGISSCETSWRAVWLKKVVSNVSLFYNEYTNLFAMNRNVVNYTAAELSALTGLPELWLSGLLALYPEMMLPKTITTSPINSGSGWGIGGEFDINVPVTDWLSSFANYSHVQIINSHDLVHTTIINEKNKVDKEYPKNKVGVGIKTKFCKDIMANISCKWTDKTETYITDQNENGYLSKVDDYLVFDLGLGWALNKNADVSLSIFNLFDDRHYEYPVGINLSDNSSDEIVRRIVGKISYKF